MSRRRRNSHRRRSSCSSKRSYSPIYSQRHSKPLCESTGCENDMAEKGEADAFWKEFSVDESDKGDEKDRDSLSKETRTKVNGSEGKFQACKPPSFSEPESTDRGAELVTSVTIDDKDLSTIVFQQSLKSLTQRDQTNRAVAVHTTRVKYAGSRIRVEIKEVLQADKRAIKTTFMVQSKKGRKKKIFTKHWDLPPIPNNDKLPHGYSSSPSSTTSSRNTAYDGYKYSCVETDTDLKDVAMDTTCSKYHEETVCCKSCCEDRLYGSNPQSPNDTYPMTQDGTFSPYPLSELYSSERFQSSPSTTCSDVFSDIRPPNEFADGGRVLRDLMRDGASCRISSRDTFLDRGRPRYVVPQCRGRHHSDCQFPPEEQSLASSEFFHQLAELDIYDTLSMEPEMVSRRSSFTKDSIHSHERKHFLRNNSIGVLETNPYGFSKQALRRKSFPGTEDSSLLVQECLPLHRESCSSGTPSSFFWQPVPLQTVRSAQRFVEDERSRRVSTERRRSSESSIGYKSNSSRFAGQSSLHTNVMVSDMISHDFLYTDKAGRDRYRRGSLDQTEIAESGFDEEIVETEEHDDVSAEKHTLVHVTTPSQNTFQETEVEGSTVLTKPVWQGAISTSIPSRSRGSVKTMITGGCEERYVRKNSKPTQDVDVETNVNDVLKTDGHSDSFIPDREDRKANNSKETIEMKSHQRAPDHQVGVPSEQQTESTVAIKNHNPNRRVSIKLDIDERMVWPRTTCSSPDLQNHLTTGNKVKMEEMDSDEKQTISTTPVDVKVEVREHPRPSEAISKGAEEASDRWAKRRKQFKDSKQWSSAGGSSIGSNVTEESVNTEETRSMDISVRDIEDRGFYTETFHSAAWMYHGDDARSGDSPRCPRKRTRPVTIRERMIKISRGKGDYPWGFRIQFCKPIMVTEVDTNGAAEEAGLQVGDYVMSVNGTDVTNMPHSEAIDLARQGPDLLALTVGSDISRWPSTPRPACRGYLHKRTQSGFLRGWRKRWFVLRHDCCLCYYRHKKDEGRSRALVSVKLEGAEVAPDSSLGKPFVFKCCPVSGGRVYYFCATSSQEMKRWLEAMNRAVQPITQNHVWMDVTRHNASLPSLAIKNPECLGLLHLLDRKKDTWLQHYCILKDACLYFYAGIRSTHAVGGIFLHGYTVKEQTLGSKRSTIELKPPSEEFKTFYLSAEDSTENTRWILAINASISKWLPLHQAIQEHKGRPGEEARK